MPGIVDDATGKEFKPNLLISTKNLARGLGGQLREMAAATSMFDSIDSFRTTDMARPRNPIILTLNQQKRVKPRLSNGRMLANGRELTIRDSNGKIRVIKATYGIMRVMQVRHMSALKHHYPSAVFTSVTVLRGGHRLRTPRLSEGELWPS